MAGIDASEIIQPQSSLSNAKEKQKKLQHWKNSYKKDSESSLEESENPKGVQGCARRLNIYQQRIAKFSEKEVTREMKRKRTRDDDIASRYHKVHHRDLSLGSSDGDGISNVSQDSPRRNRFRKKPVEIEHDKSVLARRQKQIDYGKNTVGYDRYCSLVPKDKRQRNQPSTPPKHIKYSRRAWDGLVKIWRQKLHSWDPPPNGMTTEDVRDLPESSKLEEGTEDLSNLPTNIKLEEVTECLRDLPNGIKLEHNTECLRDLPNGIKLEEDSEDEVAEAFTESTEEESCSEEGD